MISPLSTTDRYILQPALLDKHRRTLEWLSILQLCKQELTFFQKLLDNYASRFSAEADKKMIDHFQSIILYYRGEQVNTLAEKLRAHERRLAEMLDHRDESDVEYFREHGALMTELQAFHDQFTQQKMELFGFIEKSGVIPRLS